MFILHNLRRKYSSENHLCEVSMERDFHHYFINQENSLLESLERCRRNMLMLCYWRTMLLANMKTRVFLHINKWVTYFHSSAVRTNGWITLSCARHSLTTNVPKRMPDSLKYFKYPWIMNYGKRCYNGEVRNRGEKAASSIPDRNNWSFD